MREHFSQMEEGGRRLEPGARSAATPWPLFGLRAQAALYRVPYCVAERPKKLRLALLKNRTEPVLEEVGIPFVPLVEAKRIPAVERLHCSREGSVMCPDHQVIVIRHEAVSEALQLVSENDSVETHEEVHPI
jgi:hypothetical protein